MWGRRRANQVVLLGFLVNLFVVAVVMFTVWHPPAEFWAEQDKAYKSLFGMVPRILLGSMCAYLASQFHDVWAFHFWKKKTKGRALWFRNNASTLSSQLIDSTIFTVIAFWGSFPPSSIGQMIVGQYVIKLIIAVVDTPIVYLLVRWASGEWQVREVVEEGGGSN